jgi:hypothetical protein
MPQALAPDMARKSLDTLLQRVEQQRHFSADEARELLASCELAALILERLWRLVQGFLDRGMERTKLLFFLKELVDVLALGQKAFDVAQARAKAADLTPQEGLEGLSLLERAGRRAAQMHDDLLSLVRWLETPPSDVDRSSLPAGREDPDAGKYVSLDDLTARLQSGRDA